jgi:hypothetical protein
MREKRRELRSKKKNLAGSVCDVCDRWHRWIYQLAVSSIVGCMSSRFCRLIDCTSIAVRTLICPVIMTHTHDDLVKVLLIDWLIMCIYIWIQCLVPLAFCLILNICVCVAFFECQHLEISSLADFTTFIYRSDLWNLMCDMYNIYRSKKKSTDKMKITVYAMTYVSWFF